MKLYFDNNVYNRPFDDWSVRRNKEEAVAILELLGWVADGGVDLISSFVVQVEFSRLKDPNRRERVGELISFARDYVVFDPGIAIRAQELETEGFGAADAAHLAAAEHAEADLFVTCDDKLLKRARRTELSVRVVSPRAVLEEEL